MHYKNGREAKNGDMIVSQSDGKFPVIGILYDAVVGNDYCNGRAAIPATNDPYINLKECLHVDDALAKNIPSAPSAEEMKVAVEKIEAAKQITRK